MRIVEDGLIFGDYNDADCFHIEKPMYMYGYPARVSNL